jgi:predicted ABC-type transport system involved in lysophospholipase L1 biosynthesis ATPase subunit
MGHGAVTDLEARDRTGLPDPILSLQDVSLSYRRGRRHQVHVLAEVSLELMAGEVVTIRAQRAQGKTSLLRLAAGIERPGRGIVRFAGQDLWQLRSKERARLLRGPIALVSPRGPWLDVPVLTGAALPLLDIYGRREAYAQASEALARVGASECAEQRWRGLADGERALVALARGLSYRPRLLLVDDLTVTLGMGEREAIAQLLCQLASERNMAVLICADDSSLASGADRLGTLAGGNLLITPPAPRPESGSVIDFPGERPRRAS